MLTNVNHSVSGGLVAFHVEINGGVVSGTGFDVNVLGSDVEIKVLGRYARYEYNQCTIEDLRAIVKLWDDDNEKT